MIIQPANRTNSVNEYYFSRKLQEIDEMNRQGEKVINLGIGSPDMAPAADVVDALVHGAQNPDNHAYQSYKGLRDMRMAFADWYRKYYQVELDADHEIQPLTGSKEGILLLSLAFLNKGDKVLVPDPGYPTYSSATLLTEAEVVPFDLKEENGWMPDFDALEKSDLSGVKMMWVNYPNMPTGARANLQLYRKLVDFGLKHRILICNDNPYSFILNEEHLSILSVDRAKECCIELNSLSKAHNMAGWRIGMIAGAADVIANVLKVKSNMDSGMFKPLQLAAVKALAQPASWYITLNKEYQERKKLAGDIFDMLEVSYDKSSGGMFLWGKVSDTWKNGEELSDFILKRARVFITPGFIFGSNGDRYIRISLCAKQPVLREVAGRIKKSLGIGGLCHGSWC
ncbi:aminotransferase class I/II-fold pyridoxal phosphate-dependent enzyme [Culturomica sp.]|uniref:pyridoxal phosphate-dependent aminotransferase n=1 Tax=Culturomica sp. TaxID=1926652 RepID=UPI000E81A1F7|nr:aminotransferase class I/II-fold pyridoxal phosphate-dependent enzyme [Culturomica sp.]HBO27284.1 aminotransferase [Culturomica sp.]